MEFESSFEGSFFSPDGSVTFPSMVIFEELLSSLTSAGAGSEKMKSTLGDDAAEGTGGKGTEGESRFSLEASETAASLS